VFIFNEFYASQSAHSTQRTTQRRQVVRGWSCQKDSMTYRKKLIEVALPLEAINIASARERCVATFVTLGVSRGPTTGRGRLPAGPSPGRRPEILGTPH
jgi:hypothetical protein